MRGLGWFMLLCASAALVPLARVRHDAAGAEGFPGWPQTFAGKPLRPLPLTERERRFADALPGAVGRFTDGQREVILRWVSSPTRELHSSADCFMGAGYKVEARPAWSDAEGRVWSCFTVTRGGERMSVAERIYDEQGGSWTDVSGWYWAALRGQTRGPWWAVTLAAKGETPDLVGQ